MIVSSINPIPSSNPTTFLPQISGCLFPWPPVRSRMPPAPHHRPPQGGTAHETPVHDRLHELFSQVAWVKIKGIGIHNLQAGLLTGHDDVKILYQPNMEISLGKTLARVHTRPKQVQVCCNFCARCSDIVLQALGREQQMFSKHDLPQLLQRKLVHRIAVRNHQGAVVTGQRPNAFLRQHSASCPIL